MISCNSPYTLLAKGESCKGTCICCLDPHRRVSPTQRTTRYSVFKDRPRPWELVKNSHGQTCTGSQDEFGQESPARSARDGGRNLREGSLPVKSNSGASRAFYRPDENFLHRPIASRPGGPGLDAVCRPGSGIGPPRALAWGPYSALDRSKRRPAG